MAVSRSVDAGAIYALHARWMTKILGPGDSLFTPGTPVWTGEHLQELELALAGRPDSAPGRRYEEKLRDQVAGVSPEAKQLMAELHAVHFLTIGTGALSASAKVGILETILGWMPAPAGVPADVAAAMAPGLVHPGKPALMRRATQITWLIRFSAAWKELTERQRQALAADPWTLKDFTGQVDAPPAGGAQTAVLHLTHPAVFDLVVSAEHKQRITTRFGDAAGTSPDIDRRLLAVRAALTPQYGEGFDWYDDWLVRLWWKNKKDWKSFLRWMEYCHVGVGRPAPEAASFPGCDDELFLADGLPGVRRAWHLAGWGAEPRDASPGRTRDRLLAFLDELVRDSRAWDVPLAGRPDAYAAVRHLAGLTERPPGWIDSDWENLAARAGLPSRSEPGDAAEEEEISPGPPVDPIEAAAARLHVDRGVLDEIRELLDDKGQVVLYGPSGTGKTYLAVELATAMADGDASRVSVVQFHPGITYEAFFEGLRPAATPARQVAYRRTSGPLMAIAEKAAPHEAEDKTFVLVIDEINRANLPRVLGELLFLLEHRDRSARTLYRPQEPFRLPANLKIIGTMNTADRSAAPIDPALRRRFHFVPFFPHRGMMKDLLRCWLADGNGRAAIADFLDAVNAELLPLVGEHRLLGPSHFMRAGLSDDALRRIWSYDIFPLIEEELRGSQDRAGHWRWEQVRERYRGILDSPPPPR
ncbi:MAG TPA: AAA family ATPase [Trebonia sp.]